MSVADAAMVVGSLHPEHGRFVVVGDHLQMEPIVRVEYPQSNDVTQPALSTSTRQPVAADRWQQHLTWLSALQQ